MHGWMTSRHEGCVSTMLTDKRLEYCTAGAPLQGSGATKWMMQADKHRISGVFHLDNAQVRAKAQRKVEPEAARLKRPTSLVAGAAPRGCARNHAMILIAYRHGLRASEVVNLRVSDLDLRMGTIYCRRAKGSRSSLHPMKQDEVATLEKVLRYRKQQATDYVFQSERAERM